MVRSIKYEKLIVVLLIAMTCTIFCSCNSSDNLSVTFKDGSTGKISVEEIIEMEKNDGRKYENILNISGKGKITDIDYDRPNSNNIFGVDLDGELFLTIDDNIKIMIELPVDERGYLLKFSEAYMEQFYNGDEITFEGEFQRIDEGKIVIYAHSKDVLLDSDF